MSRSHSQSCFATQINPYFLWLKIGTSEITEDVDRNPQDTDLIFLYTQLSLKNAMVNWLR